MEALEPLHAVPGSALRRGNFTYDRSDTDVGGYDD